MLSTGEAATKNYREDKSGLPKWNLSQNSALKTRKKIPDKSLRLSNLDLEPPVHWEIAKICSLSRNIFLDALRHLT